MHDSASPQLERDAVTSERPGWTATNVAVTCPHPTPGGHEPGEAAGWPTGLSTAGFELPRKVQYVLASVTTSSWPGPTVTVRPLSASVTVTAGREAPLGAAPLLAPQPMTASAAARTASRARPETNTLIDAPIGGCYIAWTSRTRGRARRETTMRRCVYLVALALVSCTRTGPAPPAVDPPPVQRVVPQPAENPGYHHGRVVHHAVAYTIFWLPGGRHFEPLGTPAGDAAYERRVNGFLRDVGGSRYYALVTQYPDQEGPPSSSLTLGGTTVDAAAYPHAGTPADPLSDGDVRAEVARTASRQGWVEDVDHLYFVYTGLDVAECDGPGYCNVAPDFRFCAYHFDFADGGRDVVYAFMGDHALGGAATGPACGTTPGGRVATDPYDDVTADAQVSVTAHELVESVTDPTGGGWAGGAGGVEIGDKCANTSSPRNQAGADVYLNGTPYSIQMLWSRTVAACAMSLCGGSVCGTPPAIAQTAAAAVAAGGTFTVTVRVRNSSDTDALAAAVVVDALPTGATYVPGSSSPAPSSASGGTLTWTLGAIAVHDQRDITFRARAAAGLPRGADLRSCARVNWWDMLGEPRPAPAPACADTVGLGVA